jgi:MoxR-like ATPase
MPKTQRKPTKSKAYENHEIGDTGVVMQRRVNRHAYAPEPRPFVWPKDQVQDVATALKLGMNIMLTGPTGCGKTALPRAICAELGEPMVRFNCDGETRVSNLRGMNVPDAKDGVLTLKFNAGDLAMCMKEGYKVLLDEIDAALPSVRFVLQPVLEEDNRTLHIPETGETIVARDNGFAIFATGNTIGYRSVTRAQYAGTNMMNAAFLDRFGMVIGVEYPSREDEHKRVSVNVPECENDDVDGICRVAEELRNDDKFTSDFSTRRCIQWARLMAAYSKVDDNYQLRAAQASVIRKLESSTDARVAKEIVCRIFGYDAGAI